MKVRHYRMVGDESARQKREREERKRMEMSEHEAWLKDMRCHPWKLFGYSNVWTLWMVFLGIGVVIVSVAEVRPTLLTLCLLLCMPMVLAFGLVYQAVFSGRAYRADGSAECNLPSSGVEWGRVGMWFMRSQVRKQMRKLGRW